MHTSHQKSTKFVTFPMHFYSFRCFYRLRNGDVQEKMAQVASCLAPKEFKTCLSTVRAALASVAPAPQARARSLTYEGLIIRYKHSRGDFMVSCMREAEKILIENGQLRGRFKPPNNVITIATYSWICAVLKVVFYRDSRVLFFPDSPTFSSRKYKPFR